jgi:hypothetical protein
MSPEEIEGPSYSRHICSDIYRGGDVLLGSPLALI